MILQTLIKYFFALVIIIFVIWNRFFRDRETISFFVLLDVPLELVIIINIISLTFFFFIFYTNLKKILKINTKSKILENPKIVQLYTKIREYIFNAPEFAYIQFTKNRDLKPFLELPGSYFTLYCNYPHTIVTIFFVLPLIIISTLFLVSNLFFQNLHMFFKSLILLIPVLIMRVWIFLLFSYSDRRLKHLYQFLDVTYIKSENKYKLQLKESEQLPNNLAKEKIKQQFPILCNLWEIYSKIYSFMKDIEFRRNFYDPYVQVYTSFCFCIGWFLQLLYLFSLY